MSLFESATYQSKRKAIQGVWQQWRRTPRTATQLAYLALWLLYLISYPIAVVGVAFDVRPGFTMAWAGSILLFVQGALAVLWLAQALGWQRGGILATIIALGSWAAETIGVHTGLPFGRYTYAAILFPRLPGGVPLPVVGAWLLVIVSAVAIARYLLPPAPRKAGLALRLAPIAVAALFGAGLDLVLEPVAVQVQHYWIWHTTGFYYGIPASNFLGWAAVCAVLCSIVIAAWPPGAPLIAAQRYYAAQRAHAVPRTRPVTKGRRLALAPGYTKRKVKRKTALLPSVPAQQHTSHAARGMAWMRSSAWHAQMTQPSYGSPQEAMWLYALTALMFGVIDLTHSLYVAAIISSSILAFLAFRWRTPYHV